MSVDHEQCAEDRHDDGNRAAPARRTATELSELPAEQAEPRTFPPPEAEVVASSDEDRQVLITLSEQIEGVRCAAQELRVQCEATPEAPRALERLLVRFAAQRLRTDGALLRHR